MKLPRFISFGFTASTIVESLVALVIISIIFSISGGIYVKVVSSRSSIIRIAANNEIKAIVNEIKRGDDKPAKEQIAGKSFDYHVRIESYNEIAGLRQLIVTAFDKKGKTLAVWKELIVPNREKHED